MRAAPVGSMTPSPNDRLIDTLVARGTLRSPRVIRAMRAVPRELFVPESLQADAYRDRPLPIGHGQTISQPSIVALMTESLELRPYDRVLEIGTGCGYQAAILAELAREVFTIEVIDDLAREAAGRLGQLGYANVHVVVGDGYRGLRELAPFERIIVTAAPARVPRALLEQLADGGVMVTPVGVDEQELTVIRRHGESFATEDLGPVIFVPMVPRNAERTSA